MHTRTFISGLAFTLLLVTSVGYGNDFDDGIPIDGQPVSSFDNVNRDVNTTYIIMRAKAKYKADAAEGVLSKEQTGSINSVISGPGSTIKGDVIIIDEGKGDKTVVVGK